LRTHASRPDGSREATRCGVPQGGPLSPLLALGIAKDEVKLATRSRKGYWRMAGNSIVQRALTKWLWEQGVPNMRQQWIDLHYPDAPAALG